MGTDCWGESFGYDRWANFLTATVTKCSAPSQSLTVSTATNRITNTGFTYNTSGDLTNENGPAYTWDAEEQLTAAGGVTYTYDGNSLRVKKSNGKLYWRSIGIDSLAETDASGNTTMEYVYFAGKRVAARDASGNVYYLFEDHRGSTIGAASSTGVPCFDADYFPYGADNLKLNTCSQLYRYAGYERDPESGLDYAIFRYYNSRLGRFMSPDVLAGSTTNPQSLNRYAYVLNDTTNLVDPLGLEPDSPHYEIVDARGIGGGICIEGGWACIGVSFSLNGMPVSWQLAQFLLGAEAAGACPHNDCSGLRLTSGNGGTTVIQQWVPTAQVTVKVGNVEIAGPLIPGYWLTLATVRSPDFWLVTINVGTLVGYSGSFAIDRYGRAYWSPLGLNVGKSAARFSYSVTPGWLTGWNGPPPASDLQKYMTAGGCSAGVGVGTRVIGVGGFFNWSSGGQAWSAGVASLQAGISCGWSFQIH